MHDFEFDPQHRGLVVRMRGMKQCPVDDWTRLAARSRGSGTLVRLRDEGHAVRSPDSQSLLVSWDGIAGLSPEELGYVGLPDPAPFDLQVNANGAIHDIQFALRYDFTRNGRPIWSFQREGAWVRVGRKAFVLLNPLYSIVDAIERFNLADHKKLERRMLEWGKIAKMLPENVVVEQGLGSLNIVVASTFQLEPFLDRGGEPDFHPVIGCTERSTTDTGGVESRFVRLLSDDKQVDFASRFRTLSQVKHRYALGDRVYVVLTPQVERALGAVRRAQDGTPGERREFLKNVSGYVREALEETGEGEVDVDAVFLDHGLSDRVRGIGIWVEKAIPWVRMPPNSWLPPYEVGVRIGSHVVRLPADDLPCLREEVETAIGRGDPVVQAPGGTELPADRSTLDALDELIRRMRPTQPPTADGVEGDEQGKEQGQATGVDGSDRVLIIIDNLEDVQFRRERRPRVPSIPATDRGLQSQLFPHQQDCVSWLLTHWNSGSWGALLADDMGLGKTLEALAFLNCLKQHPVAQRGDPQPMLVVAPTGLLRNWLSEHEKHLREPGIGRAVAAHGTQLRNLRIDQKATGNEVSSGQPLPKLDVEALRRADWVLTTYETLRDYQHSFGRVRWRVAVFDEAQKIKNPAARITEAALAMNIEFALLMTGTPVENRMADIWSIVDRAEPGLFGTLKDFSERFESSGKNDTPDLDELRKKLVGTSTGAALMMRRLKEDHLSSLPNKIVHKFIGEMPERQAEIYEDAVVNGRHMVSMLQLLNRLRSVSLHPEPTSNQDADDYIRESARLSRTFDLLDEIATRNQKVLLFVDSLRMQDFLIAEIRRRFRLSDDVLVVNGSVPGHVRKGRVDTFQHRKGFDVMILSPRAGGVGLTLTAANHVIHLTRWWNPAVEDQCTDRALRIGQERSVHVYLPLARHPRFGKFSFDLKLHELIQRKRKMNRRILAPTAASTRDVRSLYRSITTDACDSMGSLGPAQGGNNVDLLGPTAFEQWVLEQLGVAGYRTGSTPRSGDRGPDGLAYWPDSDNPHTLVVRCRHTQPEKPCGIGAVREVLRGVGISNIQGEAYPMVVTNAKRFTKLARMLARRQGVRLVDRNKLSSLSSWDGSRDLCSR